MTFVIDSARFGGGSTLLTDLVSWWTLDEASGTRYDSHGSYDLTDINTVGQSTLKVGNCASYTRGNAERLENTVGGSEFDLSGDFTVVAWIKRTDNTDRYQYSFTLRNSSSQDVFEIRTNWNNLQLLMWEGAVERTTGFTLNVFQNSAYCVCASWDSAAKQMQMQILGGGAATYTMTAAHRAGSASGNKIYIGDRAGAYHWTGEIDEVAVWTRLLTSDEKTEIYNSGNGIGYPG